MATRRHSGDIDWNLALQEMGGILKVIDLTRPKELVEGGGAKMIIDKIGLDGLVTVLSPEQRRELAKRIESCKK